MNRGKQFYQHVLFHYFKCNKNLDETHRLFLDMYGDDAPSKSKCRFWFECFKNGDFDLENKNLEKCEDVELQELLDETPTETFSELSKVLNVTKIDIPKRLNVMEKIYKGEIWLPLSESAILDRLSIATSLLVKQTKQSFLWRIVTGNKTWIYFDNPKRRKLWVDPSQPSTSTPKSNIEKHKTLLCIWWGQEGMLYYELLPPNETVTADHYEQQLRRLSDELTKKRPSVAGNQRKVMLLHDNARLHAAKSVRQTLLELEWEVLPHPAYSPDLDPSNYYFFPLMQHALHKDHFRSYEEVQKWVDNWIASKHPVFYKYGIAELPKRWEKVVENEGNYYDKVRSKQF